MPNTFITWEFIKWKKKRSVELQISTVKNSVTGSSHIMLTTCIGAIAASF